MLEEVQRGPLAGEQGPDLGVDAEQHLARLDPPAVLDLAHQDRGRVEHPKRLLGQRQAGHDEPILGVDLAVRLFIPLQQEAAGGIARPDLLR